MKLCLISQLACRQENCAGTCFRRQAGEVRSLLFLRQALPPILSAAFAYSLLKFVNTQMTHPTNRLNTDKKQNFKSEKNLRLDALTPWNPTENCLVYERLLIIIWQIHNKTIINPERRSSHLRIDFRLNKNPGEAQRIPRWRYIFATRHALTAHRNKIGEDGIWSNRCGISGSTSCACCVLWQSQQLWAPVSRKTPLCWPSANSWVFLLESGEDQTGSDFIQVSQSMRKRQTKRLPHTDIKCT